MAHLVRDTERAFRKSLQIRLAEYGVPFGHWTFLRVLWENDGITQKELSAHAGVMEPTTFAALKVMEAQGYIVRKQLPTNRKNVYIHLTAKGRGLKNKLVPMAEDTNSISTRNIAPDDLTITRRVLLTMMRTWPRTKLAWEEPTPTPKRRAQSKTGP